MQKAARAADGAWWMRTLLSNVAFLGSRDHWVLVDAGVRGYDQAIVRAARALFGRRARPQAILLTHAHFDHVGSLRQLLRRWDVPVFVHPLELPYVTGRSSYPPPDPLVGGGAMAWLSRLYPRAPLDLGSRAWVLPANGRVPVLPEWRWIHTPGHTPGHVSFVRDDDRVVVAGDAVVTTRQESLLSVLLQRRVVHGPPAYFTQDWVSAAASVRTIAGLQPATLVTGHGHPLSGPAMQAALSRLAERFEWDEVPAAGRYVPVPARASEWGTEWVPPDPLPRALVRTAVPAAIALGAGVWAARRARA